MSKLHVRQIGGYLKEQLATTINMEDYARKIGTEDFEKALLTRALGVLAVAQLTDLPMFDLCPYVTDGFRDGGLDMIFFESKEKTLYLVQTKWHSEGNGSIELGDTLKFIDGVRRVLDNNIEDLNDRVKSRKLDIDRALFDANAKFVLVLAHTGQDKLSAEVEKALTSAVAGAECNTVIEVKLEHHAA